LVVEVFFYFSAFKSQLRELISETAGNSLFPLESDISRILIRRRKTADFFLEKTGCFSSFNEEFLKP
jgi:hypothetical protein